MSICSPLCGIATEDIPVIGIDCEPKKREIKLKAVLAQVCNTTDDDVTALPAVNAATNVKTAWLTAQVATFTALHQLRKCSIAPGETTDVKILACSPATQEVTKQTLMIEDVLKQESETDSELDKTIWRFFKRNITRLNLWVVDCENNLYPLLKDYDAASPVFSRANGRFYSEEEEVSDCQSILVKKAEINFCEEVYDGLNPAWLAGASIPGAFLDALLPL